MRLVFIVAIFLNALLLFGVQPMIAKALLPTFGGAPAVWLVSMVFFQAALLVGYGYAHLSSRLGKNQIWAHLGLLLLAAATLPFRPALGLMPSLDPGLRVLLILVVTVGPTFVLVSAGAPILQRWFGSTTDPLAARPYFLYSASNLGSMVALISYPLWVEPQYRLGEQFSGWAIAYALLMVVLLGAGMTAMRAWKAPDETATEAEEASTEPVWRQRVRWILLAAVPSSLLLGVTNYLTANVAPVPFLWVLPLALYLLTFTIGFANRGSLSGHWLGRIMPLVATPLIVPILMESSSPIAPLAAFHLGVFFLVAWMCHRRLAEAAPSAARSTEFYFYLSLGGVIGGASTALLAPILFKSYIEYPLALAAAFFLRPLVRETKHPWLDFVYPALVFAATLLLPRAWGTVYRILPESAHQAGWIFLVMGLPALFVFLASDRPRRQGAAMVAVIAATQLNGVVIGNRVITQERSFFGVHRVTESGDKRSLVHGNTVHGRQNLKKPDVPMTYYHPTGPIGLVFKARPGMTDVGFIGLGVGSLAAYGEPGMNITFYEIDPTMVKTATNDKIFTFLSRTKGNLRIVLGDGRKKIEERNGRYDLIVLDAFSSDAIPSHLLTVEALTMYKERLKPGGILAIHISNRYLALEEVVAAGARRAGLFVRQMVDYGITTEQEADGKTASDWMILARSREEMGKLGKDMQWDDYPGDPASRAWTDDYSNLVDPMRAKMDD